MAGSSNGAGAAQRQMALKAAREALSELHRTLIEAARVEHERQHGPVGGPGELLRLLTQHPGFAWLQPVSELLADLDALHAEPPTEDLAQAVRRAGESLLLTPLAGEPTNFRRRYSEMLQANPSVVVAHGRVRHVLAALPPPATTESESVHERHQKLLERKRRK